MEKRKIALKLIAIEIEYKKAMSKLLFDNCFTYLCNIQQITGLEKAQKEMENGNWDVITNYMRRYL